MELNFKILLALLFLFISACEIEKEIDYPVKLEKDKLVIRGSLTPEQAWVYINSSVPVNDIHKNDFVQEGVEVYLASENGAYTKLNELDTGFFKTPDSFIPSKTEKYKIVAKAPGFDSAYSTFQPILNRSLIEATSLVKGNSDYYYTFTFSDSLTTDYYANEFMVYSQGEQMNEKIWPTFLYPTSVFDDEIFNGTSYTVKHIANIRFWSSGDFRYADSATIILYHISEDLFTYFKSFLEYQTGYQDPFLDFPSVIHSNTHGGYGVFGSYNADTVTLILDTLGHK